MSGETGVENARLSQFREGVPFLALSVLVPMALIAVAEAFFYTRNMEVPLALHGLNIIYCVMAPFLLDLRPQIFQAFSLVSLLRMMNIGMPVFFDMTIYWLPFIYLPVIVVGVMVALSPMELDLRGAISRVGERLSNIDWKRLGMYSIGGLTIGALLGFLEYQILRPERLIPDMTLGSLLVLGVVMFLFVGLGEELVFRYLLQDRLRTMLGAGVAILLSSTVFAMMHSGYSNAFYLAYVFFIGLVFGISYDRTRSLFFVTVLHGSINFFLFSVFPY